MWATHPFQLGPLRPELGPSHHEDQRHLKFAYEYVCLIFNRLSPDQMIRLKRGSRECYELVGGRGHAVLKHIYLLDIKTLRKNKVNVLFA